MMASSHAQVGQPLARPFAVLGVMGSVATADHFRLGAVSGDVAVRATLLVLVTLSFVGLGWFLESALGRMRPRRLGLTALASVMLAGPVISALLQFSGRSTPAALVVIQGLGVAVCFVGPVLLTLLAALRLSARPGSVLAGAERRALWRPTLLAACLACFLAWPDWRGRSLPGSTTSLPALFGAVALATLLLFAALDWWSIRKLQTLMRHDVEEQPDAHSQSVCVVDVGIGDHVQTEADSRSTPYRSGAQGRSAVRGDLTRAEASLRRLFAFSVLGVAAGGLLLIGTGLAPDRAVLRSDQPTPSRAAPVHCSSAYSSDYCTGFEARLSGTVVRRSPQGYLLELERMLRVHSGLVPDWGPAFVATSVWLHMPTYCDERDYWRALGSGACHLSPGERVVVRGTLIKAADAPDSTAIAMAGGDEYSPISRVRPDSWIVEDTLAAGGDRGLARGYMLPGR